MQLELFKKLSSQPYEGGLECNNCGIVQPADNFEHLPSGEILPLKIIKCPSFLIGEIKGIIIFWLDGYGLIFFKF